MAANATTTRAWTELSSDLRRFIRRRVSDEHAAEDLLQETFLRIHRKMGSLAAQERLAAWVYQIARNVIHDYYRRSSSEVMLADDPVAGNDPLSGVRASAGTWMAELIGQLPQKYRQAVQLAEIEGATGQVVADRLGISLSGAKSRIQRGRAMLKDLLDDCCTFHFDRRGNLMECDPKPGKVCLNCDAAVDAARDCS